MIYEKTAAGAAMLVVGVAVGGRLLMGSLNDTIWPWIVAGVSFGIFLFFMYHIRRKQKADESALSANMT